LVLAPAAHAALASWGVHTGDSALADVLRRGRARARRRPRAAFAAPRSAGRLSGRRLIAVQLTVLLAAAVALADAGHPLLGARFAVVVAANAVLVHVLKET